MTSHDTRDPAAERLTEIEHNASAAHYDDCDRTDAHACAAHVDINDLVDFARKMRELAEALRHQAAGVRPSDKVGAQQTWTAFADDIDDAAARHLGGQ